jgi:imidazolonepropionase-like amidohydrolase
MRPLEVLALCAALAAACAPAAPVPPGEPLAIIGITVVDAERVVADATVFLRDGRIESVRPRARVPIGMRSVDGRGKFLVPGLVDAHVHLAMTGGLFARPDLLDLRAVEVPPVAAAVARADLHGNLQRYLRSGITTVFDAGGPTWNQPMRRHANETALAPRVLAAGPMVSTVARPEFGGEDPPFVHAASPEAARDLVRVQAPSAPDHVKLVFAVDAATPMAKAAAVVAAAIDEAHAMGRKVAVHTESLDAARSAVAAGADLLVHGVTEAPLDAAFIDLLRKRRTPVVSSVAAGDNLQEVLRQRLSFAPAEWVWADPKRLDEMAALPLVSDVPPDPRPVRTPKDALPNLKRLWDAGVRVAAGSGAGNPGTPHGPALFRELELLAAAGLTPLQVLEAATVNGARAVGLTDVGLVKAGYAADLVLLEADPRLAVRNLGRIAAVVRDGRLLEPRDILPEGSSDVVWRQVAAFNARDPIAFAATFAADAVIMEGDEVQVRGRAAILDRYADLFARFPSGRIRVDDELVEGRTVVLRHRVHGMDADGRKVLVIYEVQDGFVTHVWYR